MSNNLTREDEKTEKSGMMQRFITINAIRKLGGEGNERRFEVSFSSEEPYDRWWGTEILSHSEGAVDLTRLNTIGCVLYNHNRDKVIGKILSASVKDNRGTATIEIDTDAESEVVYQKMLGGSLKGTSVGYTVEVWEDVAANKKSSDGRFFGPCSIATKWTPYEVSIVSVPADPTVGVGRSKETVAPVQLSKQGVGGFYYQEKQLQINKNLLYKNHRGGKKNES